MLGWSWVNTISHGCPDELVEIRAKYPNIAVVDYEN